MAEDYKALKPGIEHNGSAHAEVAAFNIAEVLGCQAEERRLIERYFCLPLVQAAIWGGALAAQHGPVVRSKPGKLPYFSFLRARLLAFFFFFFSSAAHSSLLSIFSPWGGAFFFIIIILYRKVNLNCSNFFVASDTGYGNSRQSRT